MPFRSGAIFSESSSHEELNISHPSHDFFSNKFLRATLPNMKCATYIGACYDRGIYHFLAEAFF